MKVKKKLFLLINTIRYLKGKQIYHQVKYRLWPVRSLNHYLERVKMTRSSRLHFNIQLPVVNPFEKGDRFTFLNAAKAFNNGIDWSWNGFGKLWNYNLQYFNLLNQDNLSAFHKEDLLVDFYTWQKKKERFLEPYPVSIRIMNVIRFLSKEKNLRTQDFLEKNLQAELFFLTQRLEYHLLGNHLLENAFALMMGGAFFGKNVWVEKGRNILEKELEEQILPDGAHFELSPMYHQIIFFRVLELLDWYSQWPGKDITFEALLRRKAADMRDWLTNITFNNGDIPHFNDSADGIAYSSSWLCRYADLLGVKGDGKSLKESGYRSVTGESYELRIDFAQIGPSYQPGHAHADALSFILYQNSKPFLIEQGTSTYESGLRRNLERSTEAHNTVVINNSSQSEVWGQFRVGRRAMTKILQDGIDGVFAGQHDGYKDLGIIHKRVFRTAKQGILIEDYLSKPADAISYYHLHPNIKIVQSERDVLCLDNEVSISFEGNISIWTEVFEFARGFNICVPSTRICVSFNQYLKANILFV